MRPGDLPLPLTRMTQAQKGVVYLVGAGPGDPELLTVKAAALLASADVIYHDDLVSQEILELARSTALVISVGKRCGAKRITQNEINRKLIDSAMRRLSVVRLKSGDPLIFGRAGEEIAAFCAAGVPFEVIPGVTTAFAAAAALGCSLTGRGTASSVLFSTGHHAAEIGQPLSPTRILYMPGSDLNSIAADWLNQGEPAELPCVLISRVSQPGQRILRTTLGSLSSLTVPDSPAILLAGWALAEITQAPAGVSSELSLPAVLQRHRLTDPF